MNPLTRRICLTTLLLAALAPLQGCVPVVAVGVGAGAFIAADRRTSGAYLEDEAIELKAANRLRESYGQKVHVNVTSYNRHVLLTGEAPDTASVADIEKIALGVANVRGVANEVQIAGISSLATRANDTWLTSRVKARFIDANRFPAHVVKVVTENSTVYLRGIVTRREGDVAAELASTTGGVQKVVRVFEYVSREEAWELDRNPQSGPGSQDKPTPDKG